MIPNKITPAANGGDRKNCASASYRTSSRETITPGNWLNPRRRWYAERLAAYVAWNGRKVFLTPDRYADIRADTALDRWAVDQAADDLFALGCITLTLAGETCVLTLLSDDLDALATGPAHVSRNPRFALAQTKAAR